MSRSALHFCNKCHKCYVGDASRIRSHPSFLRATAKQEHFCVSAPHSRDPVFLKIKKVPSRKRKIKKYPYRDRAVRQRNLCVGLIKVNEQTKTRCFGRKLFGVFSENWALKERRHSPSPLQKKLFQRKLALGQSSWRPTHLQSLIQRRPPPPPATPLGDDPLGGHLAETRRRTRT
jgi:hypothetical protein